MNLFYQFEIFSPFFQSKLCIKFYNLYVFLTKFIYLYAFPTKAKLLVSEIKVN